MYGLINRAVEGLATELGGKDAWNAVRKAAGCDDPTFVSMELYPDEVTYALVNAASQVFKVPQDEVLRKFGEYWIRFTAEEGYGELLKSSGANFIEFVSNLNRLHSQVGRALPELRPPSFLVRQESADVILVDYFSHREGLTPMIEGLFHGLAAKYGETIEIELLENASAESKAAARFRIQVTAAEK